VRFFACSFFHQNTSPGPLIHTLKLFQNINSNSPRYLNSKLIPWCGPPRRIRSYNVAPPAGSNPTMWSPPRDRILRCGPSRRINSIGTRKGQGHGQGQGLGQRQGSDFPLWPLPGDRAFRCGPSRGIGLSAVAPPAGSDFPLWPLLGDRTFRCGPSQALWTVSDIRLWGGAQNLCVKPANLKSTFWQDAHIFGGLHRIQLSSKNMFLTFFKNNLVSKSYV
jgi:hypothetical protein